MKGTVIAIFIAGGLIVGAIFLSGGSADGNINNVSIVDGKQIVSISAKGGYSPQVSIAKAGIPTTLEVETRGTFDCSSALLVPVLDYRANLPPAGITKIEVPSQEVGAEVQGLCAMGMYSFIVKFEE